jgi:hypothetical protein
MYHQIRSLICTVYIHLSDVCMNLVRIQYIYVYLHTYIDLLFKMYIFIILHTYTITDCMYCKRVV